MGKRTAATAEPRSHVPRGQSNRSRLQGTRSAVFQSMRSAWASGLHLRSRTDGMRGRGNGINTIRQSALIHDGYERTSHATPGLYGTQTMHVICGNGGCYGQSWSLWQPSAPHPDPPTPPPARDTAHAVYLNPACCARITGGADPTRRAILARLSRDEAATPQREARRSPPRRCGHQVRCPPVRGMRSRRARFRRSA